MKQRLTMTSKLHLIKREPALIRPRAQKPRARQRAAVVFRVIGRVEFVAGVGLEALHAVPRDVLQGHQGPVGREQEIEVADPDDGVVGRFDDALQDAVLSRAERLVVQGLVVGAEAEDVFVGALHPVGWRGVDGFLDVASVEVDLCSWWLVVCSRNWELV